ncbi:MAG TPA: tripartite tricarboxylate transporter permease [Candidatus Limnocylindrales bacterium]|nr:tripartite tricarboxylate transporter permease [Candidatus Limnocylindrales bacterium]
MGIWVKMLTIPYNVLFPAIVAFAAIGTYSLNLNAFDVFAIAFFGLLGYFLIKLGCEPAPLLLGFVLGPLLEQHLRRALIISRGDPMVFLTRPISLALLVVAALAIVIAVLPSIRRKREVVFREEDAV